MPIFSTPLRRCTLAVALATSLCAPAFAIINSPVPASAYITQGGFGLGLGISTACRQRIGSDLPIHPGLADPHRNGTGQCP